MNLEALPSVPPHGGHGGHGGHDVRNAVRTKIQTTRKDRNICLAV